jgi:hypothetical protein
MTSSPIGDYRTSILPSVKLPLVYDQEISTCLYKGLPEVVCLSIAKIPGTKSPSHHDKDSRTHDPPCTMRFSGEHKIIFRANELDTSLKYS